MLSTFASQRWPNRKAFTLFKSLILLSLVTGLTYVWIASTDDQITLDDGLAVKHLERPLFASEKDTSDVPDLPVNLLTNLVVRLNSREFILNHERFPPLQPDDNIVIVQVHKRTQYLKALIDSLRAARDVNKTLVIFSHDIFDPKMNYIIQSIDFCKVLQIFYPYSTQLHPDSFPGPSQNDCRRDMKKQDALEAACTNAAHPDTYGHYREARWTQTKHHWFWKINELFDKLKVTRHHNGPVIFLEEDHYVTPDIFYFLQKMRSLQQAQCKQCNFLTLGAYVKSVNFGRQSNRVEQLKWISSRHNMGMVINRDTWNHIKRCAKNFCEYDDYNWDWSLQHISTKCLSPPPMTLAVVAPRVFHIGECGIHAKAKDCNGLKLLKKVETILEQSKNYLFPETLIIQKTSKRSFKMPKRNGGWGDIRDHKLCLRHLTQGNHSSV